MASKTLPYITIIPASFPEVFAKYDPMHLAHDKTKEKTLTNRTRRDKLSTLISVVKNNPKYKI